MAGIQFSGLASGLDTQSIVEDLMKVERIRYDKVDKEKMATEMKMEVWEEMNTKLYSFYTDHVFNLRSSGVFRARSTTSSDESKLTASASSNAMKGVYTVGVGNLATGAHLYSGALSDTDITEKVSADGLSFSLSDGSTTKTISLDEGDGLGELVKAINDSGLNINANYDSVNKRIFLDSTQTGGGTDISFSGIEAGTETDFMTKMGFTVVGDAITADVTGTDANYTFNGLALTSSSNDVKVNGISMTLTGKTTSDVTVTVNQDSQAIYDKVKDFVKAYNELIGEMNTKLDADYNSDYEPLTDEEKSALDDDTIKMWEDKIKSSLLRRDSTLSSLRNGMRSIIGSSSGVTTEADGFKFFSDLGIVTGDYTEKGKLHIEGDEDDSLYALKDNKLMEAIEDDADKVADFLNAIGDELHSMMNEKMKSTTMSSALTFYNDKQMASEVIAYEDRMSDLEDYLDGVESRYYKQFTAMEQMIQQMNGQADSLASMFAQ